VSAANAAARPVMILSIMSISRRLHSPPIAWAPVPPVTRASLITSVTATVILLTGDGIQYALRFAQVQQIAHTARPVSMANVVVPPAVILLNMSAVFQPWDSGPMLRLPALQDTQANQIISVTATVLMFTDGEHHVHRM